MICELLNGMWIGGRMELSCSTNDAAALTTPAAAVAIAACLVWLGFRLKQVLHEDSKRRGSTLIRHATVACLMILSAAALEFAASQPEIVHAPERVGGHLAIVFDVSNSVTRDLVAYDGALTKLHKAIVSLKAQIGPTHEGDWTGSVVTFSAGARLVVANQHLDGLARAVQQLRRSDGDARESNVAAGLALGRVQIEKSRVPGLVLLVGDGHWQSGEMSAEITKLRQTGTPVYVLPVKSDMPGSGIVAANMPATTEPGAIATARLVVRSEGFSGDRDILVRRDSVPDARVATTLQPGTRAAPVRIETKFSGRGLRHLELSLRRRGEVAQQRRLFTLVKAPPRVLVFGPAPWLGMFDRTQMVGVRSTPSNDPEAPENYDVIIVDGLSPQDFSEEYLKRLAQAVAGAGRGLLMINGPASRDSEIEPVLAHWERTEIGPLLPISTDMRQVVIDPPPRDVALIVDTSGSMEGWPLSAAKRAALSVVDQLRPVDRVSIIPFGVAKPDLDKIAATNVGKQQASDLINSYTAIGGSDASPALDAVMNLPANSCAVFFITDGAVTGTSQKPGCVTVILEIGGLGRANSALERLGQVLQIRPGDEKRRLKIDFLDPQIREERWRTEPFKPMSIGKPSELTPGLPVEGIAISYPRPEADRISVHPDAPPDPVLALRDASPGSVGVFLGDLSTAWGNSHKGRRGILALVHRLSGWSDVDRYQFDISDRGDRLELSVLVLDRGGLELPDRLEVMLSVAGQTMTAIPMRADENRSGRFTGSIPLTLASTTKAGAIFIEEVGSGPISSSQRIPVQLPRPTAQGDASAKAEIWQFGLNLGNLRAATQQTGGAIMESSNFTEGLVRNPHLAREKIYTALLAFSAICFIFGLWFHGGRR